MVSDKKGRPRAKEQHIEELKIQVCLDGVVKRGAGKVVREETRGSCKFSQALVLRTKWHVIKQL